MKSKEVRKNWKSNEKNGVEQAEKARSVVGMKNKTHFSLRVFDSDVQHALLFFIL